MSIKPVVYRHRWFDSSPYTSTSGQWYPWEYCDENKYREILAYIEGGYKYEAEMLYAIPDTHRVVPVETVKDAERYRFIRMKIGYDRHGVTLPCGNTKGRPEETDAAIDAAMLAAAKEKGE